MPAQPSFVEALLQRHSEARTFPPTASVITWLDSLLHLTFPHNSGHCLGSEVCISTELTRLEAGLARILSPQSEQLSTSPIEIAETFFGNLPQIVRLIEEDAEALLTGDPAASQLSEVVRAYPGFYAVATYRIAHQLCIQKVPVLPRVIAEHAHTITGIDIHPEAVIGERFCIDHGTGTVIGQTTHIGNDVKIYQGVTLGALSVKKTLAGQKRHPTVGNNVVIYAGATILGADTVIGDNSVIGGNVWLTSSVPPGSLVRFKAETVVSTPSDAQDSSTAPAQTLKDTHA